MRKFNARSTSELRKDTRFHPAEHWPVGEGDCRLRVSQEIGAKQLAEKPRR